MKDCEGEDMIRAKETDKTFVTSQNDSLQPLTNQFHSSEVRSSCYCNHVQCKLVHVLLYMYFILNLCGKGAYRAKFVNFGHTVCTR